MVPIPGTSKIAHADDNIDAACSRSPTTSSPASTPPEHPPRPEPRDAVTARSRPEHVAVVGHGDTTTDTCSRSGDFCAHEGVLFTHDSRIRRSESRDAPAEQDTAGNRRNEEAHDMQALVTGGSRGIGKAIAIALAENGYDVAVAARTLRATDPTDEHSQTVHHTDVRPLPGSVEETAAAIEAAGQRALALRMDLTDLASVEAAAQKLIDEWGGVDVVVNNGRHIGPGLMDTILDTPIEQYPLFLMAHGVAPIRIVQLLLPAMLERGGGTFVTISSGAGYHFYPASARPGLGYRIGKAAGHTLVGQHPGRVRQPGHPGFQRRPRLRPDRAQLPRPGRVRLRHPLGGPTPGDRRRRRLAGDLPGGRRAAAGRHRAQQLALDRGLYPDWTSRAGLTLTYLT